MEINDTIIEKIQQQLILVVGDLMLDQYLGGDVNRISPEAPVPVLKKEWTQYALGGAGNVINNLHGLKVKTRALSFIGKDYSGKLLLKMLKGCNCDTSHILINDTVPTITKTRVVARNQQVIRIDDESVIEKSNDFEQYVSENIGEILNDVNGVIISDYGKGTISEKNSRLIVRECNKKKIPIFVDPKGTKWEKYTGATICTPNFKEFSDVCGIPIKQKNESEITYYATKIVNDYKFDYLLITRSEKGITLINSQSRSDFPAIKKEIVDVSGAGDTVLSVITLFYLLNYSIDDCCKLANQAASIVISKFGTCPIILEDLLTTDSQKNSKIVTVTDIKNIINDLHKNKKVIVFTNGCFDLLHSGHVYSLKKAKELGDVLIVGLNSDHSVRINKGNKRPIIGEKDRALVLEALSFVDFVIIFDEKTPIKVIRQIRPDILVKGKDYANKKVVGEDVVSNYGGKVVLIDLKDGISTTSIIQKIKNNRW